IKNWGFTMIELLIVIAVLGVLAVAVLATINPIEQINRGRDTGSRGDTEQLLSAIDRYNANTGLWPWQDAATDNPALAWMTVTAAAPASPNGCSMLGLLSTTADPACPGTDEIKASFVTRLVAAKSNAIYMTYGGGTGQSVYICFNPQSGAFQKQADDRCKAGLPTDFPANACGACPVSLGRHTNCVCLP
ncbi:MAG: prepilin-type N-terminal cleavage/methylation domain-containing protein, partial [Candidatus Shapirobacteria bacterium]|nr:prepilin-type N-terminal cleavage/methylation domain-containing protein [Candidatus Shapirobacteria bacterium]